MELISLLKKVNIGAFDAIYSQHWAAMYQSAFYLLRDEDAVMDIVQDIFTGLWEKCQQLDIQVMLAYLRTAVRFKVANYIKAGKIHSSFYTELAGIDMPNTPGPQDFLELNDLKTIIQ
ncbi:RNA polymerase sigma factor [Chitinophaga skermanii]|uniref:RNA polymerase sigma factor n=1 Tax=Chitinophaga skermanii TaxID=331697 RepID=UPI0011E5B549|nr:sigma factor [Chitinophaga skermanii]